MKSDPPPGFLPMKDAPTDGRVVILAHRDSYNEDFKNELDYVVEFARCSTTAPYVAWLPLWRDPDDSGDCNHGSIVNIIGWLPHPADAMKKLEGRG